MMSVQTRCDKCGRVSNDASAFVQVRITTSADATGSTPTIRDYCQDPNGNTVGCFRKVMVAIAKAMQ